MEPWDEILNISDLERSIRVRETIDTDHVEELAQVLRDGGALDPIRVVRDGSRNIVTDGSHRIGAYALLGIDDIPCLVREGTYREAILEAAGANGKHGLPRTRADKRMCVESILHDPEWAGWSDREIARACNVSHTFVSEMRRELSNGNVANDPDIDWNEPPAKKPKAPRDDESEPDTRLPSERSAHVERDEPPVLQSSATCEPGDSPSDEQRKSAQAIPMTPWERAGLVAADMRATATHDETLSVIAGAIEGAIAVEREAIDRLMAEERDLLNIVLDINRSARQNGDSDLASLVLNLTDRFVRAWDSAVKDQTRPPCDAQASGTETSGNPIGSESGLFECRGCGGSFNFAEATDQWPLQVCYAGVARDASGNIRLADGSAWCSDCALSRVGCGYHEACGSCEMPETRPEVQSGDAPTPEDDTPADEDESTSADPVLCALCGDEIPAHTIEAWAARGEEEQRQLFAAADTGLLERSSGAAISVTGKWYCHGCLTGANICRTCGRSAADHDALQFTQGWASAHQCAACAAFEGDN